jgi:hypothetical protein
MTKALPIINRRLWLALVPLWLSCVDKVDISLPANQLPIVVDGMITDEAGPDTIKLTRAYPADGTTYPRTGIEGALVTVSDDTGLVDQLLDIGNGYYITNLLNGTVGRTYQLNLQIPNGSGESTVVSSTPQQLNEAGSVDSIYYEVTSSTNPDNGLTESGFNVYINATLRPNSNRRLQWTFMGTYVVTTDPAAVQIPIACDSPLGCGFMTLACADGCLCCTCYVYTNEVAPILSQPKIISGSQLHRVFMQYIPINKHTFFEKYRVEITQVELSEEVFDFYQAIQKQLENASSIFQPPFFELKGNLTVVSGPMPVVGTFAASARTRRHIFIPRTAVPFELSAELTIGDCRGIAPHSTTEIPPFWP